MRIFLTFLFICFFINLKSQSYSGPESVVYDSTQNRYFISNNSTNQILQRSANGSLSVFSSSIGSGPHGLEIVGNTLYACDGSSLKGFDLSNGSTVMNLNLGATFLNGICTDGTDYIYTTDFSAKKIYKVHIPTQTYSIFVSGLTKSPNGIIYDADNQRIIWVTWGTNAPVMQANLADSVVSQLIPTTMSNCDGIVRDAVGNYYISAWSAQGVYKFNNSFSGNPQLVISGLSNPADIYYNLTNDSLVSPNSGNNTVSFHYMGTASSVISEDEVEMKIFPNPCNNFVRVETKGTIIDYMEITDLAGKIVSIFEGFNMDSILIETKDLPDGCYIVRVRGGEKVNIKKFIVLR
jgi:hypothetical protein